MDRQPPRSTSNAIDLYIRTYYSLLRSSGEVRVRSFEEAHAFSDSSLHTGARDERPDVAAFGYSAARLPGCMTQVRRLVAGQSLDQFERAGLSDRIRLAQGDASHFDAARLFGETGFDRIFFSYALSMSPSLGRGRGAGGVRDQRVGHR